MWNTRSRDASTEQLKARGRNSGTCRRRRSLSFGLLPRIASSALELVVLSDTGCTSETLQPPRPRSGQLPPSPGEGSSRIFLASRPAQKPVQGTYQLHPVRAARGRYANPVDSRSETRLEQQFVHTLARHPTRASARWCRSPGDSMAQIQPERVGLGLQKSRPFIVAQNGFQVIRSQRR